MVEEEEEEEPAAPAQHRGTRLGPEHPAVEDELVVSEECSVLTAGGKEC